MDKRLLEETELELLNRVSTGDEAAFKLLYDQTFSRVAFYLWRFLADQILIEDVLVETYTAVWKGAGGFRGESKVITWILGIAKNLAMKELKGAKLHESLDDHMDISNGNLPDPEVADRPTLVKAAMSRLGRKHREVLDLVFFHDMTYPEISRLLGVPVNTVKTRVFYAKNELKNALTRMGVTEHDI
jgi:RNA polymerase sigma-70 factor (ECF subfamily)